MREDRGAGQELSYVDWLRLGFNSAVAHALEQRKASLGALGRLSRKEISKIPGFGSKSVQLVEKLLGHSLPPDKPPPQLAYWLARGIPIQGARALVNAGIETVEDLAGRSRDELQSIRFVGEVVISRLEEAVGKSFPDRPAYWLAKGLTPRISNALVRLGVLTEEDLRAITREQFLALHGLAESGLRCCEAVLGQPLRSSLGFWESRGVPRRTARRLSEAGIGTVERLRELSPAELRQRGLDGTDIAYCSRVAAAAS